MSSIGAVKARLVEILAEALPETQVIPGPADVTTLTERVLEVGGETTPIEVDVSGLDLLTGTEKYTLALTISVSYSGTDLDAPETVAVADFRTAVAAIRADMSLGLLNLSATVTGQGQLEESSSEWGRSAAIRFPVAIFTTF